MRYRCPLPPFCLDSSARPATACGKHGVALRTSDTVFGPVWPLRRRLCRDPASLTIRRCSWARRWWCSLRSRGVLLFRSCSSGSPSLASTSALFFSNRALTEDLPSHGETTGNQTLRRHFLHPSIVSRVVCHTAQIRIHSSVESGNQPTRLLNTITERTAGIPRPDEPHEHASSHLRLRPGQQVRRRCQEPGHAAAPAGQPRHTRGPDFHRRGQRPHHESPGLAGPDGPCPTRRHHRRRAPGEHRHQRRQRRGEVLPALIPPLAPSSMPLRILVMPLGGRHPPRVVPTTSAITSRYFHACTWLIRFKEP